MTDGEILKIASEVGWNVEHKASNDYLVRFARALMDKRWVGLTREEIWETPTLSEFAEYIEAKLKEKNT